MRAQIASFREFSLSQLKPLPQEFFVREAQLVAPDLLGKFLVRTDKSGKKLLAVAKIVEVEAYRGDDPACHAWRADGKTPAKGSKSFELFGEPGRAYIYLNYGVHWLLNAIAHPPGEAGAVLFRALEPLFGIEYLKKNRPSASKLVNLTDGPGKLTQALAIDGHFNGSSLLSPPLYIAEGIKPEMIETSERIGISRGKSLKWRFYIPNSQFLSRKTT